MSQVVNSDSNSLFIILIIIICIVTFFYIYPNILKENIEENFDDKIILPPIIIDNDNSLKQNNDNNLVKVDKNICSKQCCKFVQWPVSFNTKNPFVQDNILDKFIPSNFACNGGSNGGCVCLTKEDYNYLANHGQS